MSAETQSRPQWRSTVPLYIHLGFILDALDDGRSQLRLAFQPHLGNSRGEVHGGTVAAIADAAMSQAVRSLVGMEMGVATMTMNLNYLAPAKGEIICRGTVVRRGRSIMFAEAGVVGEDGETACRASASYRVLPKTVYEKK
ncbi:MAG: PaaI family thioesterase [Burkholderiales bacterium]|nr:PaaI family thioesterase [Burkholderiales bacterium]MCW5575002.1 PaaI family thioesterase [Burkholderiales bacterium]